MYKIKLSGIYIIEHIEGYYYIGMSSDFFNRLQGHYTQLKQGNHHSPKFQELFNKSKLEDWTFKILEYISITEYKSSTNEKGKKLKDNFNKLLRKKEKEWMKKYSINWCLNKDNKHFS